MAGESAADLILLNGRFATMDKARPFAEAVSIRSGRFSKVGSAQHVVSEKGPSTRVIDVRGRTVIPGLNDSHTHPIRGGLNYNLELRWDGVPSLADALRLLREQARRTPPPHWVRVVGGWTEFQFAERRMPTLEEINAAAPETPVFVLHLYDRAWLNGAALRAVGYTKDTPDPPGGEIQRDKQGNPTGLLIARPNAAILYSTLAKGPKLGFDDQLNSSRRFMRELNRLGVTSVIDAGGGFQNYPDDYKVIEELARRKELTTRIAYHLFTQRPKGELDDFKRWSEMVKPGQGDDVLRLNGAGEMLVYSAADFEDFLEPRPDLPAGMEPDLTAVVTHLAQEPLAVPAARDLRRDHRARADRLRKGEPRGAAFGAALVPRPRGDDHASQHRAGDGSRRRDRHPAPHGLPGRVLREALRCRGGGERAACPEDVGGGRAGGSGHRRHAGRELQPVRVAVLAGDGEDPRRDRRSTTRPTASTAWRRCACGRWAAPGSRARTPRRALSRRASWRTWPSSRATTSPSPEDADQGPRVRAHAAGRQRRPRGRGLCVDGACRPYPPALVVAGTRGIGAGRPRGEWDRVAPARGGCATGPRFVRLRLLRVSEP